jgi:ATP-binding cassette, subfamily B, bacterial PglK
VYKNFLRTLSFLTAKERAKYFSFIALRALLSIVDLLGILAVGFLATSIALFITQGSDVSRVISFGGLGLPAVNANTLPGMAVFILGVFVSKAALAITLTSRMAQSLAVIEARAAEQVAKNAFGSGLGLSQNFSREEVYFAVQSGSPAAYNSLLNAVGTVVAEGLLFTLVIFSFFVVDPISAFGAIVYFGIIAGVMQLVLGRRLQRAAELGTEAAIKANSAIGDLSEVLREATVINKRSHFLRQIHSARMGAASSSASQYVLAGMPRYIIETSLIVAVALFVLIKAASGDLVSAAGTVGVFLSGGLRLTASMLPLQGALLSIRQSVPVAEKALDLLQSSPNVASQGPFDNRNKESLRISPIGLELQNVSFGYLDSQTNALSDVTLKISPGQQAAFIGESGAGKSTLADLLLGLQEPASGSVLLSGSPPQYWIEARPGSLAYVPQKPGMVSGSIAENIALGVYSDQIDFDHLADVVKLAHLSELVEALPEGIHTDLGKGKDKLSGGQLQRIGLARALYTRPGLIVMDEATSALDASSENEINRALDEMRGRVTILLIAHRLNTIQRSDIVFLIGEGKLVDSGTFPELLARNAEVQKLVRLMSIQNPQ